MEAYFNTIFEYIRYERCLILLLSLVEPNILHQSKFTDHEIEIIKKFSFRKNSPTKKFKRNSCFRIIKLL